MAAQSHKENVNTLCYASTFEKMSEIRHEVYQVVDAPRPKVEFPCRGNCNRIFKYRKARSNHEEKEHQLFIEDEDSSAAVAVTRETGDMSENDESSKTRDDMHNYACTRLSLGLLIKNADDTVREGDGS